MHPVVAAAHKIHSVEAKCWAPSRFTLSWTCSAGLEDVCGVKCDGLPLLGGRSPAAAAAAAGTGIASVLVLL
jgi:hypothetical protein